MKKFSILIFGLLLVGCGSTSVKTSNRQALAKANVSKISKIVIIPVKITVKEAGIGSFEKLPEKSRIASIIVQQQLTRVLQESSNVETIDYKTGTDIEIEQLDEYIGLYQRVAGSAQFVSYADKAWKHKNSSSSDYTLGEKIQFIKKQTGVDKAIFVYGEDIVTSGGAKALAVLALFGGIAVNPGGVAVLHLGIVDLNDGALLWTNTIANQSMSLDNSKSVRKAILETLESSPFFESE